jgi:hypothetical protein
VVRHPALGDARGRDDDGVGRVGHQRRVEAHAEPAGRTSVSVLGFDSDFHRNAQECPAVSYGRGCQGTPFQWFLCTFHLRLL